MTLDRLQSAGFDFALWREVSARLDEALDQPAAGLDAWLERLHTTRPEIATALREVLATRPQPEDVFLRGLATSMSEVIAAEEPRPGSQIGAYRIERLLGRGGMGEVWLAARNDGRFEGQCAIKFLDAHVAAPRFAERFRQEGQLLARLAHPHITRLLDAGQTTTGAQFLVLEYVDGERIDHYCNNERLTLDARVCLFQDVVAAVAYAHSQLIIHRDLKPSNVLVTRDGVVKLVDFGIAKLLSPTRDEQATRTRLEGSVLTPDFAAPEQLLGEPLSTATDIYQLGLLLYVLLTGTHPWPAANAAQRLRAVLGESVPRASQVASKASRKLLRGDLDTILSKALRKEAHERYATAAALGEDLRRYTKQEPVGARQGATWYVARKLVQRHRLAALAGSAALISLCAALGFAFQQGQLAAEQRDRAVQLALRNGAVNDFLGMLITEAAGSNRPVSMSELLARSEQLALANTRDASTQALILNTLSTYHFTMGDPTKATQLIQRAVDMVGRHGDPNLRAELICGRATTLANTGNIDAALRDFSAQLAQPPRDPWSHALCLRERASLAIVMREPDKALELAQQALAKLRSSERATPEDEAIFRVTVAEAQRSTGQVSEAFQGVTAGLALLHQLGRENTPIGISARNSLAVLSTQVGMPGAAVEIYDGLLAMLGERDTGSATLALLECNRAASLELLGRFAAAREGFQKAEQLARQSQRYDVVVASRVGLALAALDLQELDAPTPLLDELANLPRLPNGPAHATDLPNVRLVRAQLALALGDAEAARAVFAAIPVEKDRVRQINLELGLGAAQLRLGDLSSAARHARAAVKFATALRGELPHSQRVGRALLLLGQVQQRQGQAQESHAAYSAAVEQLSHTVDADHPDLIAARQRLAAR